MTEFSGDMDNSNFNGNTILLEVEDKKYVYISGLEIFEFRTVDKILDYISLMGTNMIPYIFAIGEKYTYFISTHYKFIGNDKIEEGMLLNASINSLDPYDYHLSKNGLDCFEKLLEQFTKFVKLQIPMLWRHFFKNIANKRDYVYNFCNRPLNKFDRHCREWYLYN